MSRWATLLLLACALLPFAETRHGPFVHDDHDLRGAGSLVADPRADLGLLLRADFFGSYERPWGVSGYWRPAATALARAEWWLTDGAEAANAWLGHVVNLLLHALATWAVARLLMALAWQPALAVGVAMLFGAHPAHAEAVAWMSAACDTGAAACGLLAAVVLVRAGRARDEVAAAALLLLALFFKESGVLWLGLAPAVAWASGTPLRRVARPAAAAALAYAALRLACFHEGVDPSAVLTPADAGTRWLTWLSILPDVVRLSVWPGAATPIHPVAPATSLGAPGVLVGVGVLALLAGLALWAVRRRAAVPLLGAACMLGTVLLLAPVVRLPVGWPELAAPLFERHLYVAVLAAPLVAGLLARRAPHRPAQTLLVAAVVAWPLGVVAHERAQVWSSDEAFARAGLQHAPGSASLWTHLGWAQLRALQAGDQRAGPEALEALDRALALKPGAMVASVNRFMVLATLGRAEEAESEAARLLDQFPDEPGVLDNVARWHLGDDRPAQAAPLFEREIATGRALPGAVEALRECRRLIEVRRAAAGAPPSTGAEGGT